MFVGLLVLASCEEPTRDNLNRWTRTQKGPGKLVKALSDAQVEVGLRAYAGRNGSG